MDPKTEDAASRHWLDVPRNVQRLWRGFLAVLVAVVAAQWLVPMQPHFDIESVFGFYAWFGLAACAAMIVVAKALAVLLKRPASYYGERDD
jgi:hypothetical protein